MGEGAAMKHCDLKKARKCIEEIGRRPTYDTEVAETFRNERVRRVMSDALDELGALRAASAAVVAAVGANVARSEGLPLVEALAALLPKESTDAR